MRLKEINGSLKIGQINSSLKSLIHKNLTYKDDFYNGDRAPDCKERHINFDFDSCFHPHKISFIKKFDLSTEFDTKINFDHYDKKSEDDLESDTEVQTTDQSPQADIPD